MLGKQHKVYLFKNKFKKEDNHPDYKGYLKDTNEDEDIMDAAAWINTSRNTNDKYLCITFSELHNKKGPSSYDPKKKIEEEIIDDDIPF